MLAIIKTIAISFTAGAVIGAAAVFLIPKLLEKKAADQVKIKQISGEKITHEDFKFKGKSITFKTEAAGKGRIETDIPKTLIPEARYWMTKVHGVEISALLMYQNQQLTPYYNLGYWRRFGPVSLGGALVFSLPVQYGPAIIDTRGSIGLKLGVIGWF